MTVLTASEIAGYAEAAGFTGTRLQIAVAVALAESGGDTGVINELGCVGLWQIQQSSHPTWSVTQLQDPTINAQAAFVISSGGIKWTPWDTFNNGTYLPFMTIAAGATHTPAIYLPAHVSAPVAQQTRYSTTWAVDITQAVLSGTSIRPDLRAALTRCTLERTIDGASTVEIDFEDPTGTLVQLPLWVTTTRFVVEGLTYRYCRLDVSGSVLTATFEDELVSKLRDAVGHIIAAAGTTTRTQFAQRLAREVKVPFYGQTDELAGTSGQRALVVAQEQLERMAAQAPTWIPEDSWSCMGRIADELNWRRFSTGKAIWFGSDAWLKAHVAAAVKIQSRKQGVGVIGVGYDPRAVDGNEATFTLDGGSVWRPVVGQAVTVLNMGPVSAGPPWLVTDVTRSQFSARANVTLAKARADVPGTGTITTATAVDDGSLEQAEEVGGAALIVVNTATDQAQQHKPYGRVPFPVNRAAPPSFDCSSLTMYCWGQGGVQIPPTSQLQWATLPHVSDADRRPGDIACFGTTDNCSHVGIYLGGDSMIAADNPGTGVVRDFDIDTWTDPPYLGCVRPA